ncbi:winged helix family two component transcriptional regulator [Tahibacter aquaticus]|uniref:Winged helix family two component transcriptional regulator n=1 Tax=Tahibacter aquaticus TaxID=520092 RepID=A0A4R6Z9X7_9GAMM|nr:winged helix family two component transcriptional regulator [Tahibacter aquaticus]
MLNELATSRSAKDPHTNAGLRVLIIEDQYDIAANIWDYLERRDYRVDHAADGVSGLARALGDVFDLIVLDLGLPRLDGLALCRQLRSSGRDTPILMLTARDTLDDKLRGFAEGADDYLVKPFAMKELEARLRVLHRRRRGSGMQSLSVGELNYDPASMLAQRQGRSIALTRAQASILQLLMQQSPNVVSHAALAAAVWGSDGGDSAALHTHVYELRKLVDKPFAHSLILGVHGIGYRLAAS